MPSRRAHSASPVNRLRAAVIVAPLFGSALAGCGDDSVEGSGGAGGSPVVQTFRVRGELTGLYRGSVTLVLNGAETITLDANGPFAFDTAVADKSAFDVEVTAQPAGFEQSCVVTPASGALAGNDAALSVVCTGGPTLRITEIGSCYFHDSSCWIEVHNVADAETDLGDYTLRSTGGGRTDPYPDYDSIELTLPSKIIPPGGYALLRGDGYAGLVDGPSVVHLRDGDRVPHWLSDGFAELLWDGQSIDFVRFGQSDEPPTGLEGWSSGAAPPLAAVELGYSRSLARDLTETDTDAPADWHKRAFATAGGRNDIDQDADIDADGIPDQAERAGGTYAGLDLYAMGVREGQRDILIQIDWMKSNDPGIKPRREALEKLVATFAAHDIALHLDTGPLYSPTFDPGKFNLGGGNEVPFASSVVVFDPTPGQSSVYEFKAAHFDVRLQAVSHYALFGSSQNLDGSAGSSGYAELPGNDLIVTLGQWGFQTSSPDNVTELVNLQAAALMHELGHNLGLHHGGDVDTNSKPTYLSIMNYLYTLYGLPILGSPKEGDRYELDHYYALGTDCGVTDTSQLERGPFDPDMVLDYSDGSGATQLETAVDEALGLGRPTSAPVDFDCDGDAIDVIAVDLNLDGSASDSLTDYDDWSHLLFVFARGWQGNDSGASHVASSSVRPPFDPLTDDRQRWMKEPPPPAAYLAHRRARR